MARPAAARLRQREGTGEVVSEVVLGPRALGDSSLEGSDLVLGTTGRGGGGGGGEEGSWFTSAVSWGGSGTGAGW